MCTGTPFDDPAGMINLPGTAQCFRVLPNQAEYFLQQLPVVDNLPDTEINQPLVNALALGAPAIFIKKHVRILPPFLVILAQPVQHPQPAPVNCRYADCIIQGRTEI